MERSTTPKSPQRLRIAIEAQRLFRPKKHGMDIVALEMIKELQKIDIFNEYFILVRRDSDICLEESSNFHIVYIEGKSYPLWEQVSLLKWVKKNKPDILHCTSNTAPLLGNHRLFLTLHDVIFIETNYLLSKKGGSSYQRFGNFYRRLIAPRVAEKAEVVFTVSKFQKQQIIKHIQLPEEKIKVVYNGVSQLYFERTSPTACDEVRLAYNLPSRYIFFLGNKEPRKNLTRVLQSYDKLRQKVSNPPLLLIKGLDEEYLLKVLSEQDILDIFDYIKLVEYIKVEHLPTIYQMADMLLFPSLSEGFGIPIIEAMASGTPVITSNVTSMPEVAGDAAMLVDPTSVDEIAYSMKKILTDPALKQLLIERGHERAKEFTWNKLAKIVHASYLAERKLP